MTDFGKNMQGLQQIMAASPMGIAVFNRSKQVVYANPEAAKLFGVKPDPKTFPISFGDFISCVHRYSDPRGCGHSPGCSTCTFFRAIDSIFDTSPGELPLEGETGLARNPDHDPLWIRYKVGLLDWAGDCWAILAMDDITQRKLAENAQRESRRDARSPSTPSAMVSSPPMPRGTSPA
jgi:PAS domain-containing protein